MAEEMPNELVEEVNHQLAARGCSYRVSPQPSGQPQRLCLLSCFLQQLFQLIFIGVAEARLHQTGMGRDCAAVPPHDPGAVRTSKARRRCLWAGFHPNLEELVVDADVAECTGRGAGSSTTANPTSGLRNNTPINTPRNCRSPHRRPPD